MHRSLGNERSADQPYDAGCLIRPASCMLRGMLTIADVLVFLIANGPGRTEAELAEAIFGNRGYQQRVNGDCNLLVSRGVIERRGSGGPADPYRSYVKQ